MSAPTKTPAKRQKVAEKKSMNEIATDEFASSMVSIYHGPFVKIIVGEKQYNLSKPLLCYCSPFFNGAFKTGFKEGGTQELTLDPVFSRSFESAIQWIYTSNIVIPKLGMVLRR
ncbi:hypothetical protein N431DRAFT_458210 [Stipitochalara longipes BDJ]|nr:hypothetical protein N431DRAFT_458210 [Stipitochalara longipes BDJ]